MTAASDGLQAVFNSFLVNLWLSAYDCNSVQRDTYKKTK